MCWLLLFHRFHCHSIPIRCSCKIIPCRNKMRFLWVCIYFFLQNGIQHTLKTKVSIFLCFALSSCRNEMKYPIQSAVTVHELKILKFYSLVTTNAFISMFSELLKGYGSSSHAIVTKHTSLLWKDNRLPVSQIE